MITFAHLVALFCYGGAAVAATVPFVRPVAPPVRAVVVLLFGGVVVHAAALVSLAQVQGQASLTGLGPALSFAGLAIAVALLLVEGIARDVTVALAAAPLAVAAVAVAVLVGPTPAIVSSGVRGAWLASHIALSFAGIAAYATAAAAGAMYLVEARKLKSRRLAAVLRAFPPLDTLDRVNHLAALGGWLGLTLGIALAIAYSVAYGAVDLAQVVWGVGAWLCVSALAAGRLLRGWQARRAALVSSASFAAVLVLYVLMRLSTTGAPGRFL